MAMRPTPLIDEPPIQGAAAEPFALALHLIDIVDEQ
jgi:hypothetical protein